jgi:Na+/H+ antiporter NhaD/arsenite permease-like protein
MELGAELPIWTVVPFAGLLLSIAVLPLAAPHFWESHRSKGLVAALFSAPVIVYLVGVHGQAGLEQLVEKGEEYTSFIVLLGSLFVVTGGIVVRGSLSGTPLLNTVLIGLGALIANVIGTTGASVLLVRPLLRANAPRVRKAHLVVFFIFVVSNCGGLLTPLGDPPLFLGFLKGVPFEWTLRLWREWLLVNGVLLGIFHVADQVIFDREERERPGSQLEEVMHHEPLRIDGKRNFAFLLGIVAVIYAAGRGFGHGGAPWPFGVQEGLMALLAVAAFLATPAALRRDNAFTFGPIVEVAVLFAGIFVTMAPALLLLNAHAASFGLREPWHFFWSAGALSSFLDNAPTYLTFAATACGVEGIGLEGRYLASFLHLGPQAATLLAALSCGAVFMGANTYIGNGPNFMVKAIAEENGVAMPSFFGYMAYSGAILIPLFVVVTFVFFR